MESTLQIWTEEKHLQFLTTMEASFVRTMLRRYTYPRLDRHLPDSSESTLDSKPKRTPSFYSLRLNSSRSGRGRAGRRRTRRRSSRLQGLAQVVNGREGGACVEGGDDQEQEKSCLGNSLDAAGEERYS